MTSRNRDIVDSEVTLVATAELEYILLGTWSDDVNDPAVVFLLAQAL
jgi:hypothetical protein